MKSLKANNLLLLFSIITCSCSSSKQIERQIKADFSNALVKKQSGAERNELFLAQLYLLPVRQREDSLLAKMLLGNMPAANFKFKKITYKAADANGKICVVSIWVAPDYVAIGNNAAFIRMPLSPQAGQLIAAKFNCVLPTTKMVDEIYAAAKIKLAPLPLTEARDSLATFIKHNKLIVAQLANNAGRGIVAGHKKDVVQSITVLQHVKPNRVAIYGWQTLAGKPIQPLYTGHVDWYVDYSHGIRLVYSKMLVNNKIVFIKDVLNNTLLAPTICKEAVCGAMQYAEIP